VAFLPGCAGVKLFGAAQGMRVRLQVCFDLRAGLWYTIGLPSLAPDVLPPAETPSIFVG
jgi:hypothetical protein